MPTRKKIGLALGGGGAKGLVHIGVIKALEKEKIPIDFIAGTSMGALVGAWYAATKNIVFLENIFLKIGEKDLTSEDEIRQKQDGNIFKKDSIAKLLRHELGGKKIEHCAIPFAAVATDVADGKEVVLEKGDLVDAVSASIALPVVFQPVKIGDSLLMDGGFCNPVPADIVKEMGADFIIAVDVSSRWINFSEEAFKQPVDIERTLRLSFSAIEYEVAQHVLKQADMVLRPPVMDHTWLEFSQAKRLIEMGEKAVKENLAELREKTGHEPPALKTITEKVKELLGS